jgi:hypothetical protein
VPAATWVWLSMRQRGAGSLVSTLPNCCAHCGDGGAAEGWTGHAERCCRQLDSLPYGLLPPLNCRHSNWLSTQIRMTGHEEPNGQDQRTGAELGRCVQTELGAEGVRGLRSGGTWRQLPGE